MTPERYQQVRKLYQAAYSCAPQDRESFLRAECGSDAELLREVGSLLAADADAEAGHYLDKPAVVIEAEARLREPRPSLAARQLSHYEISDLLGAGGMGEVWRARDTRLNRSVALKVLPWHYTRDASRLQRFLREAKTASALNHQNIVTIYDIGQVTTAEGELHFIATELIEGVTLRQHLETAGRVPWRTAIEIAAQIAAALDAAHRAGIVHRDIKPENVMLRADGVVKVLDFGLAKLTANAAASLPKPETGPSAQLQTQPGMILGTMRYMSPEQARGKDVTAQTDLFSLGVLLYELLNGQPLFAGETTADVIGDILHKEEPPLHEVVADAPLELERLLHKALAKNVVQRYASAQVLHEDLQLLRQESEFAVRSSGARQASANQAVHAAVPLRARWVTWRRALWLAPVILLLAGLAWWWGNRGGRVKTPPLESLQFAKDVSWQSVPGEVYPRGTFSPDGKWVAYTSTASGLRSIWVKQATGGAGEQSTKDEFTNENPIWSPQEELAFFSVRDGQPGIWRKPPLDGTPTLLKPLGSNEGNIRLVSWSGDGSTIYYALNGNLFAFSLTTGETKQVTNLPKQVIFTSLSLAQDERRIAYSTTNQDGSHSLWIAPVQGGQPQQIAHSVFLTRSTVWHPDGQRIFYSAAVNGRYQIFVADVAGRQPVQLTFSDQPSHLMDVSADGTKILFSSTREESDLWGVKVANAEEFALDTEMHAAFWPAVSPDSKQVTYLANQRITEGYNIFRSDILVTATERRAPPIKLLEDGVLPQWSPDGKRIAVLRQLHAPDDPGLWVVDTVSAQAKELARGRLFLPDLTMLPYTRMQASDFAWARDSNSIAYVSAQGGQRNLWAVTADGSRKTQLTHNADPNLLLYCPLWSPDGKLLAYFSQTNKPAADGRFAFSGWVFDPATGQSRLVFQSPSYVRLLGWSSSGKELFFAKFKGTSYGRPAEITVLRVALGSAQARVVAVLPDTYLHNVHLSLDGQSIAYVAHLENKDNLWVMPSEGGTARKLTSNQDTRLFFSSLAWTPDGQAIYFGKQIRHTLLGMLSNFE